MEPRHDAGGAALGRLRLPRPPRHRLQPHPPERRRLRRLRRLPFHADHRTADRIARAAPGPGLAGQFEPGFSHSSESGAPGFYSVELHPKWGGAIGVALTATTRTGFGRFTFPASPHASVLIDAGGSAQPDDEAAVQVDPGAREISGSASSGLFCGQRPRYKVYFAARFARPFAASGTWTEGTLEPGSESASDTQGPAATPKVTARAGAYATFDTRGDRTVAVRVGISFVSVAGARAALQAESTGHGFGAIRTAARQRWDQALGKVKVSGGSARDTSTFYTALYHALLAPRTFNDVGGDYIGMDGAVHRARGRTQYADFSGWDIYRTEIPLLALIEPRRASDMVQSLVADAEQSGCLPRWPYANGQSMTMVGDSADPIIAAAAAFGADHFDHAAALAAMVRGASEPCQSANGEYVERQGLAGYLESGYVPFDEDTNVRNANSIYGSPTAVWGSAATTLEYAIDDFAIAQFAARSGVGADRGRDLWPVHRPRRQLAEPLRPGKRGDRAALRERRLPGPLRPAQRRRLRRGQRRAVHLDGPAGPGRPLQPDGRADQGGGAPRLLPPRPQRAAREGPTPTTPCSATSRPWRRPGSTTGCAAPGRRRRRSAAASASTARPRPAIPATTTSGRSRPGTSSARSASTRRSRGPGRWRSPRRSSNVPKCASPTARS